MPRLWRDAGQGKVMGHVGVTDRLGHECPGYMQKLPVCAQVLEPLPHVRGFAGKRRSIQQRGAHAGLLLDGLVQLPERLPVLSPLLEREVMTGIL